jgi:hypothetical protein
VLVVDTMEGDEVWDSGSIDLCKLFLLRRRSAKEEQMALHRPLLGDIQEVDDVGIAVLILDNLHSNGSFAYSFMN